MTDTRPRLWVVLLVVAGLIAGFGVYRQVDGRADASPSRPGVVEPDLAPLAPAPFSVSVTPVLGSPLAAVGAAQPISVTATGDGIADVTLYDGDTVVGRVSVEGGGDGAVTEVFDWPPLGPGVHVLHARATGSDRTEVAHSAPVRIEAADAIVPIEAPVSTTPPAPASPDATTLDASLDGCVATLTPGAGTVTVYETGGGGPGFRLLGTASPDAPLTTDELTPGPHLFVAGPSDSPADSAPVAVVAPDDCLAEVWSGDATLFDGALRLPEPVPRLWVYLGVDGGAFQRIPATGTVSAPSGTADLTSLLPSLQGETVRMEVWRAGDGAAEPATLVARSETAARDGLNLADIVGEPVRVTLNQAGTAPMSPTTTAVDFYWQSPSTRVDAVQWQVLSRPLAADDRGTTSPVLLGSGVSETGDGGAIQIDGGRGGRFEIPAAILLGGRTAATPVDAVAMAVTPKLVDLQSGRAPLGISPTTPPTLSDLASVTSPFVSIPIGDVFVRVIPLGGVTVVGDPSNTVGVILPDLSDGAPGSGYGFTATSITVDPGRAANPGLADCVRVTSVGPEDAPHLDPQGIPAFVLYPHAGTYCPVDFASKGGGCDAWCTLASDIESLGEFLVLIWDGIAYLYNGIVDLAVELIATLNPYCLSARVGAKVVAVGIAETAANACEAVGRIVGRALVTAALSMVGLPPALPTSDQLLALATGDLKALALTYLQQLGVPCDDLTLSSTEVAAVGVAGADLPTQPDGSASLCGSMLDIVADQMTGQLRQVQTSQVVNLTGMPAPFDPATTMSIEPRSLYTGATVRVVATPIDPTTPAAASCVVRTTGDIPSWDVGGFEGTKYRRIGPGTDAIRSHIVPAGSGGDQWSTDIRMGRIDDLNDTEPVSVNVTSKCLAGFAQGGYQPPVTPRPEADRWQPGEPD